MRTQEKSVKCNCGSSQFSINLNKVESVGLVTCGECEKNYFLLDSGDYWYDIIQERYPSKVKCGKCKSHVFGLNLTYEFRESSNDVRYVEIVGTCGKCDSPKGLGVWKISYSPTDSLIKNPIIFCKIPKIKYNLTEITCYWTPQDLADFIEFLYGLELSIYCWYFENMKDSVGRLSREEAVRRAYDIDYREFIASGEKIDIPQDQKVDWKREEVVSISSPIRMALGLKIADRLGLLFYIHYATNYVEDFESGKLKEKSAEFKGITREVEAWLESNYESPRGRNSFDNLEEHNRLFGNKYLRK